MSRNEIFLCAGLLMGGLATTGFARDGERDSSAETKVRAIAVVVDEDDGKKGDETSDSKSAAERKSVVVTIHADEESGKQNGEAKVEVRGKVIVIGPDGEKKEFDIGNGEGRKLMLQVPGIPQGQPGALQQKFKLAIPEQAGELVVEQLVEEERFVIGVQCEEASEVLRDHLHLGNRGVVVQAVQDDTPAAVAGLKKNDIMLSVNDADLASRADLVKAVSGSAGKELSVVILRAGESQTISVTPVKMKVPGVAAISLEATGVGPDAAKSQRVFGLRQIHPGVILEGAAPQDEAAIRQLIERLQQQAVAAAESDVSIPAHAQKAQAEMRKAIREMEQQMRQMQQQIAALQKHLQAQVPAEPDDDEKNENDGDKDDDQEPK